MHQKIAEAHKLIAQGHALLAEAHATSIADVEPEKKGRAKKEAAVTTATVPETKTPATELSADDKAKLMEPLKEKLLAFAATAGKEKAVALLTQYKVGKLGDLPLDQYEAFSKSIDAASAASTEII
jgi:hypothetical protein